VGKYALDTNVVIDALNQPGELEAVTHFLTWALPQTYLSAIVSHELAAGVSGTRQRAILEQQLLGPFERRGRLFAPTPTTWRRAGELIARGLRISTPSALNDLLLALSCREAGITLLTRDRDFRWLARHVRGLTMLAPYPERAVRDGA
jgi:predicted nucleic acid-binding protein